MLKSDISGESIRQLYINRLCEMHIMYNVHYTHTHPHTHAGMHAYTLLYIYIYIYTVNVYIYIYTHKLTKVHFYIKRIHITYVHTNMVGNVSTYGSIIICIMFLRFPSLTHVISMILSVKDVLVSWQRRIVYQHVCLLALVLNVTRLSCGIICISTEKGRSVS